MSTSWPSPPPPARAGAPRWAIALIGAATALLVAVGVFVALTLIGGPAAANEVTREPVGTPGANPFMPSVGTDSDQVTPVADTGGTYRGDTPGLYGGTRDNSTCDAAKLTGFLRSHPGQAAAWASVLGIRTSEIDSYVATLTPVLLRSDTWVTNHGYRSGSATVVNSILQSGTAVFVDKYGSPVVRCYCGNPLTSPTVLTTPVYVGPTWVSFNQTNITIVQNTTTVVNNYTLVDPWRNTPFVRSGGYGPGWQPREDEDYTGAPLNPGETDPGQDGRSGSPTEPGTPFDPMDAKCPDGTWVRSGGSVQGVSEADLTGDGQQETAVAVECGGEQSVAVYANDGSVVATLPTPTPPPGSTGTPRYDAVSSFVLTPSSLTIGMNVYGPDDTDGNPTINQVWRWSWTGSAFALQQDSVAPVEVDVPVTDESVPQVDGGPTGVEPFDAGTPGFSGSSPESSESSESAPTSPTTGTDSADGG